MLEIQNLTKKYGKFLALDNLNLQLDKSTKIKEPLKIKASSTVK